MKGKIGAAQFPVTKWAVWSAWTFTKLWTNQGASPPDVEVLSSTGEVTTPQVIGVPIPQSVAAIVHLWRQNQSAPLHVIGFELLQNGKRTVEVEPVHTLGWTGTQVKEYMRDVLRSLSQHVGQEIGKFEAQVEHVPEDCRIEECPLLGKGG